MIGRYFRHDLIRKYVSIFGTLFNDIYIQRDGDTTEKDQFFKVPIAFAPREKFLAMMMQKPAEKKRAMILPRMSFEITGMQFDPQRKMNRNNRYHEKGRMFHELVPWNINFQLNIMAKSYKDAMAIVEQILVYFQPDWTVDMKIDPDMERTQHIPIVLAGVSHTDSYENDFRERRVLIWTLDFVMKAYLIGPISTAKVIKHIEINMRPDKSNYRTSIEIQPGMTADGEPTTDINESIPWQDIEEEDNWDYIITIEDKVDDSGS